MKIVFIPNLPYTYRDHKRFGAEYFINKGYDVEVMDIHNVLIPGYKEKVDIEYFKFENHWEPKSEEDILQRVKELTKYVDTKEDLEQVEEMMKKDSLINIYNI